MQYQYAIGNWVYFGDNPISKSEYSKVYRCYNTTTHTTAILKILPKEGRSARFSHNEAEKTKFLRGRHPSIPTIWDILESPQYYYIVMEEISNGDLLSYVNRTEYFSETEIFHLFSQIVDIISFFHQNLMAHRDIKLENFLITTTKEIKIIDFGFTKSIPESQLIQDSSGTLHYAAPELISGGPNNPYKTDIWSMGVILYTFMYHRLPFRAAKGDNTNETLKHLIRSGQYSKPIPVNGPRSKELVTLLDSILQVDPAKRATLSDIKSSEWYMSQLARRIPSDPSPNSSSSSSSSPTVSH